MRLMGVEIKGSRRPLVLEMAKATGGVSSAEVAERLGVALGTAGTHLKRLQQLGVVQCVVARGITHGKIARWFAVDQDAERWLSAHQRAVAAAKLKPAMPRKVGKPGAQLVSKQIGTISPPAPKAPRPAVEVVIPANVRRTVAVAPPGRYEVRPGDVLTGGFGASRPGVDPMTGRGWGA